MNMSYFVYILECRDGRYYTGYTVDIDKRIKEHFSGKGGAKFTRGFPPLKLIAAWQINGTKGDAMRVEAFIKSNTREEKCRIISKPSSLNGMIAEKYPDREIGIELFQYLTEVNPMSPGGGTEKRGLE